MSSRDEVYGVDVDRERVRDGGVAGAEPGALPGRAPAVPGDTFDVILLHEVLEHVTDDLATLREVRRVLRPDGRAVIFCPNRLYPFETHGVFLGKRYVFGNMPLVNWLPDAVRDRLVPHARTYTHADLQRVYRQAGLRERLHTYVFPGFDHVGGAPQGRWQGAAAGPLPVRAHASANLWPLPLRCTREGLISLWLASTSTGETA